jgi:hypothetical protein
VRTFSLSHDPFDPKISPIQVQEIVRNNRYIVNWYFPFAGTCIFKSEFDIHVLAPSFRAMLNGAPFLLSEVAPHNMGGAQDQSIWNWINSGQLPSLPSPQ